MSLKTGNTVSFRPSMIISSVPKRIYVFTFSSGFLKVTLQYFSIRRMVPDLHYRKGDRSPWMARRESEKMQDTPGIKGF